MTLWGTYDFPKNTVYNIWGKLSNKYPLGFQKPKLYGESKSNEFYPTYFIQNGIQQIQLICLFIKYLCLIHIVAQLFFDNHDIFPTK